jgi:hypothetical protein
MDNQSKRIADLVIELIGAMKVELTPTGTKVEDILELIDQGIAPLKEDVVQNICRIDIGFDNYTLVNDEKMTDLREKMVEATDGIAELESRVDDLESDDKDIDVEGEIESYFGGWKGQNLISEAIGEAIDKDEMAGDIKDTIVDDIDWLLDDDGFKTAVRKIVQEEIKNALQVLVAHWADN